MTTVPTLTWSLLESSTNTVNSDIIKELRDAMTGIGFFYLSELQEAIPLVHKIEQGFRVFFQQDEKFKNSIAMKNGGLSWRGFFPCGSELTAGVPDAKEGVYLGPDHPPHHEEVVKGTPTFGQNQWPKGSEYKSLKNQVDQYIYTMNKIGSTLMEAISLALGLPKDYFSRTYTQSAVNLLRVFHYPPNQKGWGVAEHTDMGFLTFLHQDKLGGLEVRNTSGNWEEVPPKKDCFVINIGDMLEFVTGGHLKATPHRVKNLSQQSRISIPFFYDPSWTTTLTKIPSDLLTIKGNEEIAAKRWDGLNLKSLEWKNITYGEFVWRKIREVFPHL